MELIEEARAKINLTLNVIGRLDNGYHALHSLVGFANIGDRIQFSPGSKIEIEELGPFAKDLKGPNVLEKVFEILQKKYPHLLLGRVSLQKNLPVASGIGGGSADAAALLRAIKKTNTQLQDQISWEEIAREVGADVPVCMENKAVWMSGIGHTLHLLKKPLPLLHLLLINPMVPVPIDKTTQVFKMLKAKRIKEEEAEAHLSFPEFLNKKALFDFIKRKQNDLLPPARKLIPEISIILEVLQKCEGLEIASLSGAGPTCFGIFSNSRMVETAQQLISEDHPSWWMRPASLV